MFLTIFHSGTISLLYAITRCIYRLLLHKKIHVNVEFLSGVIFLYIAFQMFKEYLHPESTNFNMSLCFMFIFALGVSLDSFGVGFTFNYPVGNLITASFIFSLFSFIFTFLGLSFGSGIYNMIGNYATLIGITIMLILSIVNFCKFIGF